MALTVKGFLLLGADAAVNGLLEEAGGCRGLVKRVAESCGLCGYVKLYHA